MTCKYRKECKLYRSDNLPEPIVLNKFVANVCNYPSAEEYNRGLRDYYDLNQRGGNINLFTGTDFIVMDQPSLLNPPAPFDSSRGEKNSQLYLAWEENARLKQQIADGSLEERAKGDAEILEQRELN